MIAITELSSSFVATILASALLPRCALPAAFIQNCAPAIFLSREIHSTPRMLSALRVPRCVLCTALIALRSPHCAPRTALSAQHSSRDSILAALSTLHSLRHALHTAIPALHSTRCPLHAALLALYSLRCSRCNLHNAFSTSSFLLLFAPRSSTPRVRHGYLCVAIYAFLFFAPVYVFP